MHKKIAFLEYSDIFSGAEGSLYSLIQYLDPKEFESILLFRYPLPHQERYADLKCKVHYLAREKKWWMGSDYWTKPIRGTDMFKRFIFGLKILFFAKKEKIDILHINLLRRDTFWCAWFAKLFGIKVVGHSRSDTMHWIPSKKLQEQLDAVICVSDFVREKVLLKFPEMTSAYTIYDPVDYRQYENKYTKEEARVSLNFSSNQLLLSSVGLLSPHKGHDMAIRAFAHLSSQFPEYLLLIAGGGSETELIRLKELALELGISEKIHFTEKQIAGVERVYTASNLVFSLTTRGEAFGRVPFEANACSAAVLAPSKGAALELIKDGENGFLVDPLDQKAVEAKAIEILSDMERTQIIVRNAQNVFKPLLSPENSAKKVEEIYYKVLSHGY